MRAQTLSPKLAGLWAMTAALTAAALSGCFGGVDSNSNLYVKDALTDEVSAVHVTFTKAQAKMADGGWFTVFTGKETIELLSLSSADAKAKLAAFNLPQGDYDGLRIAVSEVEVTHLDGTRELLNVFGNVVIIADSFTVGPDGIDILVDFDLEQGVDLAAGTYTPIVADVQTSDDDHDEDGEDDVEDADDDEDGREDDEDEDDDGDGEDDEPRQHRGESEAETCQSEVAEELADAQEERSEELAEAGTDRDAVLNDSNSTPAQHDLAWASYNVTIKEAEAEYQEAIAEAQEENTECRTEEEHEDEDEEDESEDGDEDESDDEAESEDGEGSDD